MGERSRKFRPLRFVLTLEDSRPYFTKVFGTLAQEATSPPTHHVMSCHLGRTRHCHYVIHEHKAKEKSHSRSSTCDQLSNERIRTASAHNTRGIAHNTRGSPHNTRASACNTCGCAHNACGSADNTCGSADNARGTAHNMCQCTLTKWYCTQHTQKCTQHT